jgi:hypothetical protein
MNFAGSLGKFGKNFWSHHFLSCSFLSLWYIAYETKTVLASMNFVILNTPTKMIDDSNHSYSYLEEYFWPLVNVFVHWVLFKFLLTDLWKLANHLMLLSVAVRVFTSIQEKTPLSGILLFWLELITSPWWTSLDCFYVDELTFYYLVVCTLSVICFVSPYTSLFQLSLFKKKLFQLSVVILISSKSC